MYLDHWELPARPFDSAPDQAFYYASAAHEEVSARLIYAARNAQRGALLWGPPGVGKTLVLEALQLKLEPERFLAAYIRAPVGARGGSPDEILYEVLAGLGETELSPLRDQVLTAALWSRLEEWLDVLIEAGRRPVLLIDDAHVLTDRAHLEPVWGLLGTGKVTVVLSGQERLAETALRHPELESRLDVRAPLGPLRSDEALAYILYRIELAGGRRGIFTRKAAEAVTKAARCIPGNMNRIADLCLMTGMAAGLDRIGPEVVAAVLEDMALPPEREAGK